MTIDFPTVLNVAPCVPTQQSPRREYAAREDRPASSIAPNELAPQHLHVVGRVRVSKRALRDASKHLRQHSPRMPNHRNCEQRFRARVRSFLGLRVATSAAIDDTGGHHFGDVLTATHRLAHIRTAEGQQRCIHVDHTGRQAGRVDRTTGTGIDDKAVVRQNLVRVLPTVEDQPIVSSDDERKFGVGIGGSQGTQRSPRVGRARQVHFEIGNTKPRHLCGRRSRHVQTHIVGTEVKRGFQGVEWRNHQPHFLHHPLCQEILHQGEMPAVHRIERPTEDADSMLRACRCRFHANRFSASGNTTFARYSRASSGVMPA